MGKDTRREEVIKKGMREEEVIKKGMREEKIIKKRKEKKGSHKERHEKRMEVIKKANLRVLIKQASDSRNSINKHVKG